MSSTLTLLHELRAHAGPRTTQGLDDATVARFDDLDPKLGLAVREAVVLQRSLRAEGSPLVALPEDEACAAAQEGFVNFYAPDAVNPYVALAARGPWLVTLHGAVVHDSGGYGMLGFGHHPDDVADTLARPWVVANVMTPSPSHRRFVDALRAELGHTRAGGCPFDRFLCVNSGSEAVTVGMRIADRRAKRLTDPGGPHEGARVRVLAMEGGFHGRTDRPAHASASTRPSYLAHLRSFRDDPDPLVTVPMNDVEALRAAFAQAEADGTYLELVMLEPVMGEGRPGVAVSRAFYDEARRLTRAHGSLLLVDSIQAGLRAHGVLSIVDYPGFADAEPPDLETWSKAINAAQYPLSVLGMSAEAAAEYVTGIYGNTMTANPRGLEVGIAVLDRLTPALRAHIVQAGTWLREALEALQAELPELVTGVTGTGLLVAAHLDPEKAPVLGEHGVERACRVRGLGVIHGGRNAIRLTPHFAIGREEIALVVQELGAVLRERLPVGAA
ncbi:MAG: aminotransferase class III-fold pyridoxal phosphate-dependent enzyme [Alphaproteobacteria bacterium]|nr:aminotransferase class III-fold pyridoxal phosphate-dependent enzyme [Alphaproteobacteria bacterium]